MLPKRRLGDCAYVCDQCDAALPKSDFMNIDWRGGSGGEPRYKGLCASCQVDADDGYGTHVDDSAWARAEREVERRYGIPSSRWLAVGEQDRYRPLGMLWLRLAQQYAAERYAHAPLHIQKKMVGKREITVADAERLCEAHGLHRIDQASPPPPTSQESQEDDCLTAVA